jgi:ketosteroid isomerase-like protein
MAFTGPLEDRILIRELYGRYGDASWRGDREAFVSCFTQDGCWTSHLFDCNGHADLRAEWDRLWSDWEAVAFLGEIGAIEVDGDTAKCRSYAREVVKLKSGGIFKLAGHYADSLRRENGEWLFARRDYVMTIPEA